MTGPALDPHTTALVTFLTVTGRLRVGDGERPAGAGWQGAEGISSFEAYCTVHPMPAPLDGSLADPYADVDGEWQITSVGPTQHAAAVVADQARAVLLNHPVLTIFGRTVQSVSPGVSGGIHRDDTTTPPLFYGIDRYQLRTTPTI